MDILGLIELFLKYVEQLGTVVSFTVLASIMILIQRGNVKRAEESNEKFDKVLESQEEMKREYRQGFITVHEELSDVNEKLESLDREQHENNLLALRSIITNVSLPRDYRLAAYDDYTEKGGNSWVHEYVRKELLQEKGE